MAARVSYALLAGLLLGFLVPPGPGVAEDATPRPLQGDGDWPMYGASADHSFSAATAPPDALGLVWSLAAKGPLESVSAVEADGFVYIADFDLTPPPSGPQLLVHKVVEGNGSFFTGWSTLINVPQTSALPNSVARGIPRSLAVAGNLVYALFTAGSASANREVLVALDASTGSLRWTFNGTPTHATTAGTRSAPAVGSGILVFGSQDANGTLYALNPSTGAIQWWIPAGAPVRTVPAIMASRVYVTAGTRLRFYDVDGQVPADDPPREGGLWTGDLVMDLDVGSTTVGSPIVVQESVYLDAGGALRRVDRLAGGTAWVQNSTYETTATPASTGSLIVTRRSDDRLYAYDAVLGQIEWVRGGLPAPTNGADIAVADGRVFLSAARSGTTYDLVALDAADGTIIFRNTTAGRPPLGAPIVAGGKVLVTEGPALRAFRGQPDLAPDKVVMSAGTVTASSANANVTVTIRNLGDEPVSGVRVRVFDGDPTGTGQLIGQFTVGTPADPLDPNALTIFATTDRDWTIGQHDVWVLIDRAPAETNEANNARAFPIYVQAGPRRDPIVLGSGPYALALLGGFAIGVLVLWFPLRRFRELRRKETEK